MKLKEVQKELTRLGKNWQEVENGKVDKVSLSIADHGLLSGWVYVSFHGSSCGFGGYHLGRIGEFSEGKSYCSHFITRTLEIVGAKEWGELNGMPLRCLHEGIGGSILAIGHFIEDKWFCPKVEWEGPK